MIYPIRKVEQGTKLAEFRIMSRFSPGKRQNVADIRQSKERRTGDQGFVRRSFVLMPEVNIDG